MDVPISNSDGEPETFQLRRDSLTWREVDGEMVALEIGSSLYFSANRSGLVLWQALAEGTTLPKLTDILVRTFGLDPESAEASGSPKGRL